MELSAKLRRIETLRREGLDHRGERERIRAIMNGGRDGIQAVMAWEHGRQSLSSSSASNRNYGEDLPAVNLIASGLDRLAQIVGRPPTLKPPYADDEKIRDRFQRRADIVKGWDHTQRFELQYPQIGRWLPGYGFVVWVVRQGTAPNGDPYPKVELRDPYDCYPGWFGADQQPQDMAVVRKVPLEALQAAYPDRDDWQLLESRLKKMRGGGGAVLLSQRTSYPSGDSRLTGWEGKRTGVEVVEYYYDYGTCYLIPELEVELAEIPNPLMSGPSFVLAKRFSFDRAVSQYHHVIGLMTMMAKLNILGLIAAEDSVFRETNIIGELESGEYERGRFAINLFAPGTRIEKPVGDLQQQVWAQIDRVERQLRIGAQYDVSQDAISPNSFATGAAITELGQSRSANIREYHTVLRHGTERVDAKRLEWAENVWPNRKCMIYDMGGGRDWYRPAQDIKNDYRTRRIYGAMATWDDSEKIVGGLQLLQGEVLDVESMQENIDGLTDINLINERILSRKAQTVLFQRLQQEDPMMSPQANMALVEVMEAPSKAKEILKKHFTPQEPQMSPEEEAFLQQTPPGAPEPQALPPEPVTSILSRLEQNGEIGGGVQTVGTMRR